MTLCYLSAGAHDGGHVPVVRDVDIRNCTFATLAKAPIFIEGYSEAIKINEVTIAIARLDRPKAGA